MTNDNDQVAVDVLVEVPWHFRLLERLRSWVTRQRRRLPYLVWWNDELDVVVTLSQDKLDPSKGLEQLFSGSFFDAEKVFRTMGITFDTGMGEYGRDWEWDWSLKGPISVRFHGRATRPELRIDRRPRLVVSNRK